MKERRLKNSFVVDCKNKQKVSRKLINLLMKQFCKTIDETEKIDYNNTCVTAQDMR